MDPRVALIKEYYRGLPTDRAKVESYEHGFGFLDALQSDGTRLEYGELTLTGMLHKYKLSHIPAARLDELLLWHVQKKCNVCLYFDDRANSTFCFNLDNNHKVGNTEIIPEMAAAIGAVRDSLARLGCEPLVLASGRGYHVWCRVDRAVPNDLLYEFMMRTSVGAMAVLHGLGLDHRKVKFNVYPDRRTRDTVSLRLFGSEHAKNGVFSRVLGPDGLLDEEASWAQFERHMRGGTTTGDAFMRAHAAVMDPLRASGARPPGKS